MSLVIFSISQAVRLTRGQSKLVKAASIGDPKLCLLVRMTFVGHASELLDKVTNQLTDQPLTSHSAHLCDRQAEATWSSREQDRWLGILCGSTPSVREIGSRLIFPAQRSAMAKWMSVCLSRWCIMPKWLSRSSCDLRKIIAQPF